VTKIGSEISNSKSKENEILFKAILEVMSEEQERIKLGGGTIAIEKQHNKGRLTARERIQHLIDLKSDFFEMGLYAAYGMYEEYGSPASSGTIIGIGSVLGQECMIVANDATVKAGAYFEVTLKKNPSCTKDCLRK